ncbi:MAG: hypothetical protein VKI82_05550 [Leptolyngbya sp.]|nr:hypothetical protein [Leptolyngbya sp.]
MVSPSVTDWGQPSRQAQTPSVPISVYRDLATELKATQALVDSLTQQNQYLSQQNQFLRQEVLKFADSAAHLKQVVDPGLGASGAGNPTSAYGAQSMAIDSRYPAGRLGGGADHTPGLVRGRMSQLTSQVSQMLAPKVKADHALPKTQGPRPKHPQPRVLYTEERLGDPRPGQHRNRPADLSGLWLATTILLIVISAFGAGFLIMKPLLNPAR